jgi:hypothetical protein
VCALGHHDQTVRDDSELRSGDDDVLNSMDISMLPLSLAGLEGAGKATAVAF